MEIQKLFLGLFFQYLLGQKRYLTMSRAKAHDCIVLCTVGT